jgi:outer membrane scaffolding protein for murein synthesis (MipA/OmpV family)
MRTSNNLRQLAIVAAIALGSSLLWPRASFAAQKPLWEFGLGVGALVFMDYRGADTSHAYPVPVPYFVYRGKFLQADRNGLKGRLFDYNRFELNISLNATAPVGENATRRGMPDLKPTVEVGPSLDLHVWRSTDERVKVDVRLPVRAAFTIESSPRAIGWFFAPHVNVDFADVLGKPGWNLGLLAGPLFADDRYHDYFYSVAPQFASAGRPAYRAREGYSGAQVLAALSKRYPKYWVGAYIRHDTLSGAAFTASPLVKRDSYWSAGVAIAWMIGQSSRLVDADE